MRGWFLRGLVRFGDNFAFIKLKNEIEGRNLTAEFDKWDILYIHTDHMLILGLHVGVYCDACAVKTY